MVYLAQNSSSQGLMAGALNKEEHTRPKKRNLQFPTARKTLPPRYKMYLIRNLTQFLLMFKNDDARIQR